MKSKQFSTFNEAKEYLNSSGGEVKYWGREGTDAKTYVYTLTIGNIVYHILLESDGYLQVTDQRFKTSED